MFLEQQISISEWFLKDNVTLKAGEMTFYNYIKYIQIENSYFPKQYFIMMFYCIFI